MRYTLIEMVQLILSSMDSDEVNSIEDTIESNQVAKIIKSVYYDIASDIKLPEHEGLFELNASGTTSQPVLMTVPSKVTRVDWIKYDNSASTDTYKNYVEVKYLPFQDFLDRQTGLRELTSNVGEMQFTSNLVETFDIMYWTNKDPVYYTTFDEYTLIFDAYDSDEDTTLQKSKTMCKGVVYPVFELQDAFAPDIDPTAFSYLINKAKTRAFFELKQMANQEAAAESRRQKVITQDTKRRGEGIPALFKTARFGREGPHLSSQIPRKLRQGS